MTAHSAAERARAWRQRRHAAALDEVMGLLATLPEVAIADALGRLTTGQLRLISDHLLTVSVRQTRVDLDPQRGSDGSVHAGANGGQVDVDAPARRLAAGMTERGRTVVHATQDPAGSLCSPFGPPITRPRPDAVPTCVNCLSLLADGFAAAQPPAWRAAVDQHAQQYL